MGGRTGRRPETAAFGELGDELTPSWSPDGKHLAFCASREAGEWQWHLSDQPSGTGLVNLTGAGNVSEFAPSWSPDGTHILFAEEGRASTRLFVMERDGGGKRRLTDTPGWWPDWSPDGKRIVYTSTAGSRYEQLWVMDSDGTNHTQLARDTTLGSAEPSRSPAARALRSFRHAMVRQTLRIRWTGTKRYT